MSDESQNDKPEKTAGDIAHSTTKAILSLIPVVGGGATEIFTFLITAPIEKRRDELIQSLVEGLQELEKRFVSFKIDQLAQNEVWVSTLIDASRIAIATHQKEKRLALRNAVLNAALPQAPDETRQKMFLEWLDRLTVWHIKILELFETARIPSLDLDDGKWVMDIAVDELSDVIEIAYPQLSGEHTLYIQVIKELHSMGLIANLASGRKTLTAINHSPRISIMAEEFLAFISSPLEKDNL